MIPTQKEISLVRRNKHRAYNAYLKLCISKKEVPSIEHVELIQKCQESETLVRLTKMHEEAYIDTIQGRAYDFLIDSNLKGKIIKDNQGNKMELIHLITDFFKYNN